MKSKTKNERKNKSKGITLIALVITIIVLLILAGVSIATLTDNNGILKQASNAKEKTVMKGLEEEANLVKTNMQINKYTKDEALTQSKLLNAINVEIEGSTLQGNKVVTSDLKYAIVVKNDKDLTIEVIRNQDGILADGELEIDLEYNEEEMLMYIYPRIGGLQSYKEYAEEILSKIEDPKEKQDIFVKGICRLGGMTEEQFYEQLQKEGMTIEEYIEQAIQMLDLKNIDEIIIMYQLIDGYEEKAPVELEVTLNDGTVVNMLFPKQSKVGDVVLESGKYKAAIKYGEQEVTKEMDVQIKEPIDQTQIFEYNSETGYITGVKEEYIKYVYPQQESVYGISQPKELTYGAPYLIIPEKINDTTIVGIADDALKDIINIYIVKLPNTLKTIGKHAFWSTNIKAIEIPNSVQNISTMAFYGVAILKTYIPSSVTTIGSGAFSTTKIINCEASEKPEGWNEDWCGPETKVNWGQER